MGKRSGEFALPATDSYLGRHRSEQAPPDGPVCPACEGTGRNIAGLACARCGGTGLPDFRVATP